MYNCIKIRETQTKLGGNKMKKFENIKQLKEANKNHLQTIYKNKELEKEITMTQFLHYFDPIKGGQITEIQDIGYIVK